MKAKFVLRAAVVGAAVCLAGNAYAATVLSFGYTGSAQSFIVPVGVSSIQIEAWGAQGFSSPSFSGGLGGFTSGTLDVTAGQTLFIYVGGQGEVANIADTPMGGGFNGGGNGVVWSNGTDQRFAGGGGGASDIRLSASLSDRVIVAGGGGGASSNGGSTGGAGGGLTGGTGGGSGGGTGGTQTAGGSIGGGFGVGGSGLAGDTGWVGGGGGGWYGGGASAAHYAGGGGSSYIGGVTDGAMTQGVHSGNGAVKLTFDVVPGVPEPATWGMMIAGLGAVGTAMRRARSRQAIAFS